MQGNLNFVQTIRDPVHGPIPITDLEVELLKTQCVGKLRWIKQMGLAFFSFPGANHTRFEHSIGTMYVAHLMFDRLSRSQDIDENDRNTIANHVQDFRLAALFHDLGHAPFSHTLEEFFARYPEYSPAESRKAHTHEYYTKQIIKTNPEIGTVLRTKANIVAQPIDVNLISSLSVGEEHTFGTLFSGSLDVDRLDYLMRDNYYCGLPFGSIDLSSLVAGFTFEKVGKNYKVYFSKDTVSFIEGFLTSKFQLARTVFNHPKNRSMALSFFKLLKNAYDNLLLATKDRENVLQRISFLIHNIWTDYDVFYFIENPIETWKMHEKAIADKLILKTEVKKASDGRVIPKLPSILKGDSPESAFIINPHSWSPENKYNLNLIALSPFHQRQLSEKIRREMSFITYVKIESYDITIKMDGETRNICEVSPIVDSLVNSCLEETKLAFYSGRKPKLTLPIKEISEVAGELRKSREKNPFGSDIILLVENYLHEWTVKQKELSEKHLFFQGDTRFQAFFAEVTRGLKIPYDSLAEMQKELKDLTKVEDFSNKCFKYYNLKMKTDMDILTRLGLMYRRAAIIEISPNYYPRVERRISWHGRHYASKILEKDLPIEMTSSIRKRVIEVLEEKKKEIEECLRVEAKGTAKERRLIAKKKKDFLVCLGS